MEPKDLGIFPLCRPRPSLGVGACHLARFDPQFQARACYPWGYGGDVGRRGFRAAGTPHVSSFFAAPSRSQVSQSGGTLVSGVALPRQGMLEIVRALLEHSGHAGCVCKFIPHREQEERLSRAPRVRGVCVGDCRCV